MPVNNRIARFQRRGVLKGRVSNMITSASLLLLIDYIVDEASVLVGERMQPPCHQLVKLLDPAHQIGKLTNTSLVCDDSVVALGV